MDRRTLHGTVHGLVWYNQEARRSGCCCCDMSERKYDVNFFGESDCSCGQYLEFCPNQANGLSTDVSPANVGPSTYANESHTDSETGYLYRFEFPLFGVGLDGEPMLKFSCSCTVVWLNRIARFR